MIYSQSCNSVVFLKRLHDEVLLLGSREAKRGDDKDSGQDDSTAEEPDSAENAVEDHTTYSNRVRQVVDFLAGNSASSFVTQLISSHPGFLVTNDVHCPYSDRDFRNQEECSQTG